MTTIASPLMWAALLGLIGLMLALDLGVFHRRSHVATFRESLTWSVIWVAISAIFGGWLTWQFGLQKGTEFATGYLLEKALSVDNLFVMLTLLQAFAVPPAQRHRVLFYGVFGALVLRGVFIALGVALVSAFHPILFVFGALLVLAAVKMAWPTRKQAAADPAGGALVRLIKKLVPVTSTDTEHFFHRDRQTRALAVTPLFLALLAIEGADLVFAVDSIPAVFSVTQDPFIVFSSNVLALLGLRSLFFVLAAFVERFHLL
jgi:tellurite resistance protein TerC